MKQGLTLLLVFELPHAEWCELASQPMMRWVPSFLHPFTSFSTPDVGGGSASSYGKYADPKMIFFGPSLFGAVIITSVRSL
jgi:hypothetical protein